MRINWHLLMIRLGFCKPTLADAFDRLMQGRDFNNQDTPMNKSTLLRVANRIERGITDHTDADALVTLAQTGAEPLFYFRPRSDGGYEGPIHASSIEDVRVKSGAWLPLYAAPTAHPAPPDVMGLPFNEAKARILAMPADDARGMAISLMISLSLQEKYAAPLPAPAPLTDVQIRPHVQRICRHHDILNGVLEADLSAKFAELAHNIVPKP